MVFGRFRPGRRRFVVAPQESLDVVVGKDAKLVPADGARIARAAVPAAASSGVGAGGTVGNAVAAIIGFIVVLLLLPIAIVGVVVVVASLLLLLLSFVAIALGIRGEILHHAGFVIDVGALVVMVVVTVTIVVNVLVAALGGIRRRPNNLLADSKILEANDTTDIVAVIVAFGDH